MIKVVWVLKLAVVITTFVFCTYLVYSPIQVPDNCHCSRRRLSVNYTTLTSNQEKDLKKVKLEKDVLNRVGRNYSIISASVPNFANTTIYVDGDGIPHSSSSAWGYVYNLPMTALAWKRMGFGSIAIMTVDYKKIDGNARILMNFIDKTLRRFGAIPVYFDVPSYMKTRLAQVLRLAAGDLLEINDDDFIITNDADLWPLDPTRYVLHGDKEILITNAYCCGKWQRSNKDGVLRQGYLYREYPLSNIGMTGRQWRTVMGKHIEVMNRNHHTNNYTFNEIKPMIDRLKQFEAENFKNIFNTKHGGAGWSVDQQWASVNIGNYFLDNGVRVGQLEPKLECFRFSTRGWQAQMKLLNNNEIKCLGDAHVHKTDIWKKNVWGLLRPFAARFFDEQSMADIEKYKLAFHDVLEKKLYDSVLEF